jgi:uncharacterized membrane protein
MKKLVLVVTVLLASTFAYAQYTFCNIDYPLGFGTRARGINDLGQIAGSYADQNGNLHALLIQNGKFIPLAPTTILGTEYSDAYKINNRGDVVGQVCDDVACHGFLLSKGVLTILDYPGASDTGASGINESGTISGYWDLYDASGNFLYDKGFTWKDGNFTELTFPGSWDTFPTGNNDFGVVVGGWDTSSSSPYEYGFVDWMGKFISFDAPFPGVALTQADGINDFGLIVGQEYTLYEDENGLGHGFLAVGPAFTQLNYPGAVETTAWGINLAGQMVGNWYDETYAGQGWLIRPGQKKCPSLHASDASQIASMPNAQASGRKISVPARTKKMSQ